jgi:hypothetical protein
MSDDIPLDLMNSFEIEIVENVETDSDDYTDTDPDLPASLSSISYVGNHLKKEEYDYKLSQLPHTNAVINNLIYCLNHWQFPRLVSTMERIRTETYFFTPIEDIRLAIGLFYKYVKVRNWLKKIVYKKRYQKCQNIINSTDLCLVDISNNNSIYRYYDIHNSCIYLFSRRDLIHIFKMALCNNQFEFPNSYTPRNPYTNLEFSVKTMLEMCSYLKQEYRLLNKTLPNYISQFIDSYYNVQLYFMTYMSNHVFKSYKQYIDNLDEHQWSNEFKQFINDHMLYRQYCPICMPNVIGKSMLRRLVGTILAINYLNNLGDGSMGNAIEIYKYTCFMYDIHYEIGHERTHSEQRRIVRAVRRANRTNS